MGFGAHCIAFSNRGLDLNRQCYGVIGALKLALGRRALFDYTESTAPCSPNGEAKVNLCVCIEQALQHREYQYQVELLMCL